MLEATQDIPEADIWAHRTRIAEDARSRFPDAGWRPATDGPPAGGGGQRAASTRPRRARLPLEAELRVRSETLAKIKADARARGREPSETERFWMSTASYLRSLDPATEQRLAREDREDAEAAEVEALIAEQAQAEVDATCEGWGNAAPWLR
jgi:hypothetical protein